MDFKTKDMGFHMTAIAGYRYSISAYLNAYLKWGIQNVTSEQQMLMSKHKRKQLQETGSGVSHLI